MNEDKNKQPGKDENKDAAVKPEPETLHTADPQEHMEGPVSTLLHKLGGGFDTDKTKKEADEEKEKDM